MTPLRVLLVDDNPDDRALVSREIRKVLEAAHIAEAGTQDELDSRLADGPWDAVVTDYMLRFSLGTEVLIRCKRLWPDMPVIMFTASGNEEIAVAAMKDGLDDYITKTPKHYGRVPYALMNGVERARHREAAQAALSLRDQAERRLHLVFDAAAIGTWECRGTTGHLRYSDQIGPMFGHERGFVHAGIEAWLSDVHEADRTALAAALEAARHGGAPLNVEYRTRGDVGEIRWIGCRGLVEGGDPLSADIVGIATDITERKRLEDDLRRADRQKDEFLAMLAHELRNPLAPLMNAHALLGRSPTLNERDHRMLQLAQRQATQLARLVDDLLEVSRITSGKILLKKEPVLISAIVYNAVESVHPLFEQRRHTLQVRVPDEQISVVVDSARIAQVLENLLTNAAKYTPDGGDIRVTVEADDQFVCVKVEDNGVGVPADLLPHLFTLFTQAERSIDRSLGGLGVGLALVKRLVELHGGTVEAFSNGANRGACFSVCIPRLLDEVEGSELPLDEPKTPGRRALRVLVVDDNRDAADSLALLLEEDGYSVAVAHDGPSGLATALTFHPQVAILDIGLPGMDGYALAKAMADSPTCRGTLLIALSGYGDAKDRERSREAGFVVHLAKPTPIEQIRTLLSTSVVAV